MRQRHHSIAASLVVPVCSVTASVTRVFVAIFAVLGFVLGSAPRGAVATERPPHIADYQLNATLDASHRAIDGTMRLHWTNSSNAPATDLWWHLYLNAFASRDSLYARTGGADPSELPLGRIDLQSLRLSTGEDLLARATGDPTVPDDTSQLYTPLPRAVSPGASIDVIATFRAVLPRAANRVGYWRDFVFASLWFPKIAVRLPDGTWAHFAMDANSEFFADFGRYDVSLRVPHGDVVGATGRELRRTDGALFDTHDLVADDVHDFAWTAWREFEVRTRTIDGVLVRVLHAPGLGAMAERDLDALEWAIPHFRARFGRYPYPLFTVVIVPRGASSIGGVEYPTLVTTSAEWFELARARRAESQLIHEWAHQYFYGLIATDEASIPFLDEALAEYTSGRAMSAHYGDDREMFDALGVQLGYWAFDSGVAARVDDPTPVASPASAFRGPSAYADLVYLRGATILRTLERTFGTERFDRALSLYAFRGRFGHPGPADLVAALDDTGSDAAAATLRALCTGDAAVNYRLDSLESQGMVAASRLGSVGIPVEISARAVDGAVLSQRWSDGASHWAWRVPQPVASASIDPDWRVPLDRNRLDNDRALTRPDGSWFALVAFAADAIDAMLRLVGP